MIMNLTHPGIDYKFEFGENNVYELVVENKELFAKLAKDFVNQADGDNGEFQLFEGVKDFTFSTSVFVVSDVLRIDINNRRIITKLHDTLSKEVKTTHFEEIFKIRNDIFELLETISEEASDDLIFDEVSDVVSLFKMGNLRFNSSETSIVGVLIEYAKCLFSYLKIKLLVVVNLRSYLSDDEYDEFMKYCSYNEFSVLCLEAGATNSSKTFDKQYKKVIIDEDLCEIY